MINTEIFWKASINELKAGLTQDNDYYICLLCGHKLEKGIVYSEDGVFYAAQKYMQVHINKVHHSVFAHLLNLDKKYTGLSEHQNHLLRLFYEGDSDAEVQHKLGIGSLSTIRNHRFVLREKERQARILLVLMDILKDRDRPPSNSLPPFNEDGKVCDTGLRGTGETEEVLKKYFPHGKDQPLQTLKMTKKNRLTVLQEVAGRFEPGRVYNEKEVNAVLENVYDDFGTLRRYLIDYGFMERKSDGSQYWIKSQVKEMNENMDRKRELKQQYKETKIEGGVYQIRNRLNNKVCLISTPNFKTINGKRMELQNGGYRNKQLQEEWNEFGEPAFAFEVLEVMQEKDDPFFDRKGELDKLEKKWLERLQPYEERGYH